MPSGFFVPSSLETWMWIPTISNTASPSTAEWGAGTDITNDIAEVSGFEAAAQFVETPTMQGGVVPKISGRQTLGDCNITFDEHSTYADNTPMTTMTEGTSAYIGISRYDKSPAAGDKVEIWPVTVAGINRKHTAGNEPAQYVIGYAVNAAPVKNAVLT
jgi:hypothetical protein